VTAWRNCIIVRDGAARLISSDPIGLSREVEAAVIRRGQQFTGSAVFPMSRFGMGPPKAALGAVGTRDEVSVQFTLIAQP